MLIQAVETKEAKKSPDSKMEGIKTNPSGATATGTEDVESSSGALEIEVRDSIIHDNISEWSFDVVVRGM